METTTDMKNTQSFLRNLTAILFCALITTSCAGPWDSTNSDSITYYTVTWKNYDGSVLKIDTDVEIGTMPSYDG